MLTFETPSKMEPMATTRVDIANTDEIPNYRFPVHDELQNQSKELFVHLLNIVMESESLVFWFNLLREPGTSEILMGNTSC